jgi:hypothetical protein
MRAPSGAVRLDIFPAAAYRNPPSGGDPAALPCARSLKLLSEKLERTVPAGSDLLALTTKAPPRPSRRKRASREATE